MPFLIGQRITAGYSYPVMHKGPIVNTNRQDRFDFSRLFMLLSVTATFNRVPATNQASVAAVYENTSEAYVYTNLFNQLNTRQTQRRWTFTQNFIGVQNSINCAVFAQSPDVFNLESLRASVQFYGSSHYGGV